jgi:hypothetical protein
VFVSVLGVELVGRTGGRPVPVALPELESVSGDEIVVCVVVLVDIVGCGEADGVIVVVTMDVDGIGQGIGVSVVVVWVITETVDAMPI